MKKFFKCFVQKPKCSLIVVVILFCVLLLMSSIFHDVIFLILEMILCFIDVVIIAALLIYLMPRISDDNVKNIGYNTCIVAVFLIVLCMCISFLINCFGLLFYEDDKYELIKTVSNAILTLIAPIIALLGVHYTNLLNQQNAKEERRLNNKPYIKIKYNLFMEEINFTIKNITNNICIPEKFKIKNDFIELNFRPISFNEEEKFGIKNILEDNDLVELIFKDTLGNTYITEFEYSHCITDEYIQISEPKLLTKNELSELIIVTESST